HRHRRRRTLDRLRVDLRYRTGELPRQALVRIPRLAGAACRECDCPVVYLLDLDLCDHAVITAHPLPPNGYLHGFFKSDAKANRPALWPAVSPGARRDHDGAR